MTERELPTSPSFVARHFHDDSLLSPPCIRHSIGRPIGLLCVSGDFGLRCLVSSCGVIVVYVWPQFILFMSPISLGLSAPLSHHKSIRFQFYQAPLFLFNTVFPSTPIITPGLSSLYLSHSLTCVFSIPRPPALLRPCCSHKTLSMNFLV